MGSRDPQPLLKPLSAAAFSRRFRLLILLAWNLPPVVGLGFLFYIQMFTTEQMVGILSSPLQFIFIIGWILISLGYFTWFARPVVAYLGDDAPDEKTVRLYRRRLRQFPLHFWTLFLIYLLMAPSSVILSGEWYTDFRATSLDWFRIHLVALIVSIIVGLPIFFRALDLFGLTLKSVRLEKPLVSIKVKVLLLGALMPLLVDTMIVQYYWTRTGYFSFETFVVWLMLELLAVAGSLLFIRSLGQSLWPLQRVIHNAAPLSRLPLVGIEPLSTDELGVIAGRYAVLLKSVQGHNRILRIGARLIGRDGKVDLATVLTSLVDACQEIVGGDEVFLILHDEASNQLLGIAQTGEGYNRQGHFRLSLDEPSMAAWIFKQGQTMAIDDASRDPRVSLEMRRRFNVQSALGAPLQVGDRTIGVVVTVETRQTRHYSKEDLVVLEEIANEAAVAIGNHRLLEEREQVQRSAQENEGRVRLLLDSTVEAIYGADIDGRCTFVNQAFLDMLGYAHEDELLGQNIHEMIHHSYPDGRAYPKHDCAVRKAMLRDEIGHSADEVHWRKDGVPVPVEYWSHPVHQQGELVGAVVTFVDITERLHAEEDLQRLHQRNELLLESTADGIIGVDTDLHCTFANRAAADLLGFEVAELVGMDLRTLLRHDDQQGEALAMDKLPLCLAILNDQTQQGSNASLWRRNGDALPVEYSANPIHENDEVTGAVMIFRDVTEARAIAYKMDYLASHDPLTGLVNRREFEDRLQHCLEQARNEGVGHVLCYLDLDQFKVVNDTCGHVAGDELLRQLATQLHGKVRQSDLLARLGGDEFGILLDSCPLSEAMRIADQLRRLVEAYRFAWEDKIFNVGVSIGMVTIDANTESTIAAMSDADSACYAAKDAGRNRIHVYEVNDSEMSRRRGEMQWVSRLTQALEDDRFILRYQPIVPVGDPRDDCSAFELLLTLKNDDGSITPPGAFIPAAERYSVMDAIDRWVVTHALAWLQQHRSQLDGLARCSINLSGQSIGQDDFLAFLVEQLSADEVPAEKVCFEITETAAVANLSSAVRFMKTIKQFGCRFALDDFGSGMSSFNYLKALPVDYLKIDGNFVRDMANDPVDRAMVQAIHQVGHVMNIQTIAEFVENDSVLAELRVIGVDYAQGYGIAHPRDLADYLA